MLVLAIATACSGGGGTGDPSLVPVGGSSNPSVGGFAAVSSAHQALLGGMLLCLTGSGSAVITAVRPVHPSGTIDVLDYATRTNPLLEGGELLSTGYGALTANGFTVSRTVDRACGNANSGQGDELAVELSVPPGTNAGATGWQIDYQIGGHAASTTFPQGVVLCSTPTVEYQACQRLLTQFQRELSS
jgi:hypothetical protein